MYVRVVRDREGRKRRHCNPDQGIAIIGGPSSLELTLNPQKVYQTSAQLRYYSFVVPVRPRRLQILSTDTEYFVEGDELLQPLTKRLPDPQVRN